MGVLAVTDHDSLEAVPAAIAAGERLGVRVVPGVELSVKAPSGSMHLVAYFPEAAPPLLTDRLVELRRARERRAERIVARLAELGAPIRMTDVAGRADGAIGRPHIAETLLAAGHVRSRQEAFDRYLADGGDAWVPHEGLGAEDAVRLVADAGGASSLAHPGTLRMTADQLAGFVQRLAGVGLTGIEVHRPEHTPERRHAYGRLAKRFGLVPSGGSDFHHPAGVVRPGDTGYPPLPADTADLLLAAAEARS